MRVLLLSPELDQAVAVAHFLRGTGASMRIVGGLIPGQTLEGVDRRSFDLLVPILTQRDLEGYDLVLPTGSRSTQWLIETYGSFWAGNVLFDAANLRCYNKLETLSLASGLGVPIPITWQRFEEIPLGQMDVFFKPAIEGGRGSRDWVRRRDALPFDVRNSSFIFQERIRSSSVFATAFVAEHGKIITSYQHQEMLSMPPAGGSAVVVRSVQSERLQDLSERLIHGLNYSGWGLVEFKFCPKREDFVLMEINAKLWASIEFGLRAHGSFAQVLLGRSASGPKIRAMVWPHRACWNGPAGLIRALPWLVSTPWSTAPIDAIVLVQAMLPRWVQGWLRNLRGRGQKRSTDAGPATP
jgi:hypothetical protein